METACRFATSCHSFRFAEGEGFEPPNPLRSTVFKTAAINHSANPPSLKGTANLYKFYRLSKFFKKYRYIGISVLFNLTV